MQLFILDKNSYKSAKALPLRIGKVNYAQKLLVELGQLMSSVLGGKEVNSKLYKKVPQGKELQLFIKENPLWIWNYYVSLKLICQRGYGWDISQPNETLRNCDSIQYLFWVHFNLKELCNPNAESPTLNSDTLVPFRYAKYYESDIPSKTLLPMDKCIMEYRKYIDYKISKERG